MNKIQKLTQAIRDYADCEFDYGTLKTLKMIDDESIELEKIIEKMEIDSIKKEVFSDTIIKEQTTDIFFDKLRRLEEHAIHQSASPINLVREEHEFVLELISKYKSLLKTQKSISKEDLDKNKCETARDLIFKEYEKGNIVFMGFEGPMVAPLKDFITQPVDGILYDLNRSEEVVLTYIHDPKWVNDFAVAKVIRALKDKIDRASEEKV